MEGTGPPVRETVEFTRIVAFTDGVFAIAITLLVLNLVYLSLIVLIPFPTELLGDFRDRTDSVVLYAAVVGTAAMLTARLLGDGLRRGLVRPGERDRAERMARGVVRPALIFYASIPVALLTPIAGQLVWLALLLQWVPGRLPRRRRR